MYTWIFAKSHNYKQNHEQDPRKLNRVLDGRCSGLVSLLVCYYCARRPLFCYITLFYNIKHTSCPKNYGNQQLQSNFYYMKRYTKHTQEQNNITTHNYTQHNPTASYQRSVGVQYVLSRLGFSLASLCMLNKKLGSVVFF